MDQIPGYAGSDFWDQDTPGFSSTYEEHYADDAREFVANLDTALRWHLVLLGELPVPQMTFKEKLAWE
jgi:hypothetical protein